MPNEILDTMQEEYERRSKNDPKLGEIRKQIKNGATYQEAEAYGTRSGEILSDVLQGNITEDVFNGDIPLEDLIVPMMRANYDRVVSATSTVQSSLNKSANIGMKAIVPEFDEDAAVNLAAKMMSYDSFEDAEWLLGEPVVTNSLGIVTDMLHANADFQFRSGMSPKFVRTAEPSCCDWCASLEGVYEYRDLSSYDDVWKRHANCRCEVTYVPGDGKAQDVWAKKYMGDAETKRIENRAKYSNNLERKYNQTSITQRAIRTKKPLKFELDIQFFANDNYYKNKTDKELLKGIKSTENAIDEHLDKISNPSKYIENFDSYNDQYKQGVINFWRKEVLGQQKQLESMYNELERRKRDEKEK